MWKSLYIASVALLSLSRFTTAIPAIFELQQRLLGIGNTENSRVSSIVPDEADFGIGLSIIGESGVPAMHAALLQDGRVVFLDKIETYTDLKLKNGHFAYSSIYDPNSHAVSPLKVLSNAFCAAGAFAADGRLLTFGGNENLTWLDSTLGDGLDAVRYLDYASAQTLSDGSIFVAAGTANALDPNNRKYANPTYEILDKGGISNGKSISMSILSDNIPYWMYPILHLLKDGSLFVFAAKSSQVFDVTSNAVVKALPKLPGLFRTYPNTGSSVMLPLSSRDNFTPKIMICGGGGWQGPDSPTDASCGLIEPMSHKPEWRITSMPEGRCMVEGILLLDGTVLWINGANRGAQGFGIADKPTFDALIFDPRDGTWTTCGTSQIARLYHSVALMLLDGTVLVGGSNPNDAFLPLSDVDSTNQYRKFPTELRLETFIPPYLRGKRSEQRPTHITLDQKTLIVGETQLKISFRTQKQPRNVKVMLYHGGFVTHSLHMGQVMVELDHSALEDLSNGDKRVSATVPNIALAPGPYVIYLLVDGVPGLGQFVSVQTV